MRRLALAALLLGLAPTVRAEDRLTALSQRPDFEVLRRAADGRVLAVGKNGVVLQRWDDAGAVIGVDNSGRGAVMCVWKLYVEMVGAIDACAITGQEALRDGLIEQLAAINAFVAGNSLESTSIEQLDQRMADRWSRMRGPDRVKVCTQSGHAGAVADRKSVV